MFTINCNNGDIFVYNVSHRNAKPKMTLYKLYLINLYLHSPPYNIIAYVDDK